MSAPLDHPLHGATIGIDDKARSRSIADAVWREILWLMPPDRDIDIHVRGQQVDVTLGPPPASPHTEASVVS